MNDSVSFPQSISELEDLLHFYDAMNNNNNHNTSHDDIDDDIDTPYKFHTIPDIGFLGCHRFRRRQKHQHHDELQPQQQQPSHSQSSLTGLIEEFSDSCTNSNITLHFSHVKGRMKTSTSSTTTTTTTTTTTEKISLMTTNHCNHNNNPVSSNTTTTHLSPPLQQQHQSPPKCHVRWIDLRSLTVSNSNSTSINHHHHQQHPSTESSSTSTRIVQQLLCTSREQLVHLLPQLFYYNDSDCTTCNNSSTNNNNKNNSISIDENHHHHHQKPSLHQQTPQPQHDTTSRRPPPCDFHSIINQYSPWYYNKSFCHSQQQHSSLNDRSSCSLQIADCTILILPLLSSSSNDNNNIHDQYSLLSSFRISDIIPSVALYSSAILDLTQIRHNMEHSNNNSNSSVQRFSWLLQNTAGGTEQPPYHISSQFCQVMIYRKLPSRALLSFRHPEPPHHIPTIPGCLYETYITYPITTTTSDDNEDDFQTESQVESSLLLSQQQSPSTTMVVYRMVGPPYIDSNSSIRSCRDLYQHLQHFFIRPHIQLVLQQEIQNIQEYFIAWPESQHYQATLSNDDDNDDDNNNNNDTAIREAPWNVYPLCYCFPGNDVSKRQFIQKTCQYVPKTIQLLQECFNSMPLSSYTNNDDDTGNDNIDCYMLRTALYSRLEPDSVLEAHTGWADLANHVYRVHIPIDIPQPSPSQIQVVHTTSVSSSSSSSSPIPQLSSCCGTWVDGCVQYHSMDSILMFDDSKVHRAFNYSQHSSRTVLILDVARPMPGYPLGTATGGHSNELDTFIEQFQ